MLHLNRDKRERNKNKIMDTAHHKLRRLTKSDDPQRQGVVSRFCMLAHVMRGKSWRQKLLLLRRIAGRTLKRLTGWWRAKHRQYGWRWRMLNGALAVLILAGIVMPVVQQLLSASGYQLNADTLRLIGPTDSKLASQLTYDAGTQMYQFNQSALQSAQSMRAQLGAASGQGGDTSTYALDIPRNFNAGVTYTDVNTQLSFALVPQFGANPGKEVKGHLVYPVHGAQAIYTVKSNGLKEDVVVQQAKSDVMSFSYHLNLPKTLEAKVIPGSNGAIGIYSADPTLFTATASDSKDQAILAKARETGDKTNLVFGIPSPTVKTGDGTVSSTASARFVLKGDNLTVVASGLTSIHGAFSIDPSVVITSASDFQTNGNNEGMINFDATNNQISRGSLTGGTVGSWNPTSSTQISRRGHGVATYNGYLYAVEGNDNTVEYAPLNSDGSVGTWQYTTPVPANQADYYVATVAYNGYLYAAGGCDMSWNNCSSTLYYAPLNSDGSVGTWQYQALDAVHTDYYMTAYNGYMYEADGGYVIYAPIHANGSLGDWTSINAFTDGRSRTPIAAYNGYLYVVGGYDSGGHTDSIVSYAPINADGSLGTWNDSSLPTGSISASVAAYNGYLYVAGGYPGGGTPTDAVIYAQLNADGAIGAWQTTVSLGTAVARAGGVAYNGYLYVVDGDTGSNTATSTVQYAKINPAGTTVPFTVSSNTFSTARDDVCSTTYNGHIYAIGGSTDDASTASNIVQYATLNTSTGDASGWSATTSLPAARAQAGCVAWNGHLYVAGGWTTGAPTTVTKLVYYTSIGANGALGSTWTTVNLSSSGTAGWTDAGAFVYASGGVTNLYVIGRSESGHAAINASTGALGAWDNTDDSVPYGGSQQGMAQIGNYLYSIGGQGDDNTTVLYAAIGSNGVIGAWNATTDLNEAAAWVTATVVNGCLYIVGGYPGAGDPASSAVQYACPNSDGSIPAWHNGPTLTTGTGDIGLTSYGGYIYGIGGCTDTTCPVNTVMYAKVNNGGSGRPGAFTNNAGVWGWDTKGYIYGDKYVYQIGINSGIDYASYNADGSVSSSSNIADSTALNACDQDAEFELNGYIYSIGGDGCSTGVYSKLDSNGLPAASSMLTSVPNTDSYPSWATYNGYVYLTGGGAADTSIYYAKPGSNGDITSWSTGTTLPHESFGSGMVAYGGYLYLLGGGDTSGDDTNAVSYAKINSNGSLGSWQYTTSMDYARYATAIAYDGFIYVLGGYDGSFTAQGTTEFAPILSNGALGTWQSGPSLTSAAGYGSSGVHGSIVYAPGFDSYASVDSIARIGHYSKTIAFGYSANITGILYNGTVPRGDAAVTYQAAGSDGVFRSAGKTADVTGTGGCIGTIPYTYFLKINVTLDDSYTGVFADAAGTNAYLADITVSYNPVHPPPNIRLRGGQTLQTGVLSPFDTCIDNNGSSGSSGGSSSVPSVVWSTMTHGGGSTPSASVPAGTTQTGDVVVVYMTSEDGAQTLTAPSGSGSWTTLVSNLSETYWHHSAWQSPVLTSAQATAINGHTISGNSTHDYWSEVVAVIRGASGTQDPAVATGKAEFASSAPSTISVSSMTPSGVNRLALLFVDEGSDSVSPSGNPSLSGWTTVQSSHGIYGDTAHGVALFTSTISSATGTQNITTQWPSWTGNGGYGWISVGLAPSP